MAAFWGPPRTGKSTGIELLRIELESLYPGLAVIVVDSWSYENAREASFLEDILTACDHTFAANGKDADKKRRRLIEHLIKVGLESELKQVVLIIDDAQELKDVHLKWLSGIHNSLSRRGVRLMTLLVGQEELQKKRLHLLRCKKDNLVGRFMVHVAQFHGLRDAKELQKILEHYDTAEWPEGSGWTYTRYYADAAFQKGWRLAKWSKRLWESFELAKQNVPPENQPSELQMEYLVRTIERVLLGLNGTNITNEVASEKLIASAIAGSGYLARLQIITELVADKIHPNSKTAA